MGRLLQLHYNEAVPGKSVITLTTDFGTADHFVGVLKGVILRINPDAELVDISHQVAEFEIEDGAFTLAQSYGYFPPGTIHLVVVDPGVGSSRRPIVVSAGAYRFVAPDNGVLSAIYDREESVEVRHITAAHYFLSPVSHTFHGRDIFAPVAAWLSRGVKADSLGACITDYVRAPLPKVECVSPGLWRGVVLKVDRFGNLVTNITPRDVPGLCQTHPRDFRIEISGREIGRLCLSYLEASPSEIFAILGSSGYLEISMSRGSAAQTLKAKRGTALTIRLGVED